MKTFPLLLCVVGILQLSAEEAAKPHLVPPAPEGRLPGRFQLVSAVIVTGSSEHEPVLFRIDTSTGQVWRYDQDNYPFRLGTEHKNIVVEGFSLVSESYHLSLENAPKVAESLQRHFAKPAVTTNVANLPATKP